MKGSAYNFLKGLGAKVPQKVITSEYNRIRRNLVRSVKGYEKKGFDVSFFDIPEKPKKITQSSINKLNKAVNEWKYYTGQKGVDVSMLGPNVTKTGQYASRNIGSKAGQDIAVKRQQAKAIQDIIGAEDELFDRNNEWYKKAVEEGYDIAGLPRDTDNLAIKIYEIAEEALDPGEARTGRQQALFSVVQLKATLSIQRFDDMGVLDPTYNVIYSFNLSQLDFVAIATEFESWLWASDQYTNPDMNGLEKVIGYMTRTQKNLSFFMKQQLAEAAAEEDFTEY